MVPGYGDDDGQSPYGDEDVAALDRPRRPRRNLVIVVAVVAIALVGGLAVAMLRSGSTTSGPPPTIVADGAPTKITAAPTAPPPRRRTADAQNKLIYDRVNSAEASNDTTLLTPDNGPIKDAGSGDDADNANSRASFFRAVPATMRRERTRPRRPATRPPPLLPLRTHRPTRTPAANDAASPDAVEPIGPRKVRTVVVRPDGTILSSNATDAATASDAASGRRGHRWTQLRPLLLRWLRLRWRRRRRLRSPTTPRRSPATRAARCP